jgi:hypothetical protein
VQIAESQLTNWTHGKKCVQFNVDLMEGDRRRWLSIALCVARVFSDTSTGLNRKVRSAAQKYVSKNMHSKITEAERSDVRSWLEWPQRNDGIVRSQEGEGGRINGFKCAAKKSLH